MGKCPDHLLTQLSAEGQEVDRSWRRRDRWLTGSEAGGKEACPEGGTKEMSQHGAGKRGA